MDRALHLTSREAGAGLGFRIVGTVNDGHLSVCVGLVGGRLYEICGHEADLVVDIEPLILLRRIDHEVVALDVKLAGERNLTAAERLVLEVVRHLKHLGLTLRIVVDHQLDRVNDGHHTLILQLQVLADAVLEEADVAAGVRLRDTAQGHELTERLRCVATTTKSRDGDETRVIPAIDDAILYQLLDVTLTGDNIGQIQLRELDLARRMREITVLYNPVIERAMILELQRAEGVRDALYGVLDRVCEVIHRVDAPLVTGVVVMHVGHTVDDRVTHVQVRGCHVDLRTQGQGTVCVLAVLHVLEELKVLFDRTVTVRRLLTRVREVATVCGDLLCGEIIDEGKSLLNQKDGLLIHDIEVIGCEEDAVLEVGTEPLDVTLDRLDEFGLLLHRVRVIEAEVKLSMVLLRHSGIQNDRLCMADVQITVRLRWESCMYVVINALGEILLDLTLDEMLRLWSLLLQHAVLVSCFHRHSIAS